MSSRGKIVFKNRVQTGTLRGTLKGPIPKEPPPDDGLPNDIEEPPKEVKDAPKGDASDYLIERNVQRGGTVFSDE